MHSTIVSSVSEVSDVFSVIQCNACCIPQLNNLLRVLKNEKTPLLRNRVTLPLLLSPERDEELARLTEGRVPAFAHDLVPHYLRTKHDPMVEERLQMVESKAASVSADAAQVRRSRAGSDRPAVPWEDG